MTGRAGDIGSYKLAGQYGKLMSSRFSAAFICGFEGLKPKETTESYDGIYQQLWRLGQEAKSGLEVWHEAISIAQETVEICELLEINPYEIETSGRIYLLNDSAPVREGRVIGRLTADNARVIISKDGTRYLTRPTEQH